MEIERVPVAYIRVSTKKQKEKLGSIAEQTLLAKKYADDNGLTLNKSMIFIEDKPASKPIGTSDINEDFYETLSSRPILKKILSLVKEERISHLIVYTRDRLYRSVDDSRQIDTILEDNKVKLVFTRPGEYSNDNTENLYQDFLEIIFSSIAEFEINVLSDRVKLGAKANVLKGYWPGGRIPIGYTKHQNYKKKTVLNAIENHKEAINRIFYLYNHYGHSYREIAIKMKADYGNILPQVKWTKATIETILNNEVYTGHIVWNRRGGRRNPGKRKESEYVKSDDLVASTKIIDESIWKSTSELKNEKFNLKDPKYFNTPYILKHKLVCGQCRSTMKVKNYGKNKKSSYRCTTTDNETDLSELVLDVNVVHEAFWNTFKEIFYIDSSYSDELFSYYSAEMKSRELRLNNLISELEKIIETKKDYQQNLKQLYRLFPNSEYEKDRNKDLTKPKSIGNAIQDKDTELFAEIKFYEKQLTSKKEELQHLLNNRIKTKDELMTRARKFIKNIDELEDPRKRMIVHILVNKVIVNKTEDGISLEIIMKPSSFHKI